MFVYFSSKANLGPSVVPFLASDKSGMALSIPLQEKQSGKVSGGLAMYPITYTQCSGPAHLFAVGGWCLSGLWRWSWADKSRWPSFICAILRYCSVCFALCPRTTWNGAMFPFYDSKSLFMSWFVCRAGTTGHVQRCTGDTSYELPTTDSSTLNLTKSRLFWCII